MNFKGHLTGGLITGAFVTYAATKTGADPVKAFIPLTLVTVLFSIFPDLDTSSIPQRWFYRFIIIFMFVLGAFGEFEYATLLGIIALTPVIDQHRGWTHSWYAAFLGPVLLLFIYYFFAAKKSFLFSFNMDLLLESFIDNKWIVAAAVMGWSLHILLDSKLFFKSRKGHL